MKLLPFRALLLTLAVGAASAQTVVPPAAPASAAAPNATAVVAEAGRISLRLEKFTLANGLEVILVPDRRLPLVAVNLWVHAGPRNEGPGQTGFAHLFEHLMFAGSRHLPRGGFDQMLDAAGGSDSNGSTNFDRTNYFFTLPSHQLALGLWLQSDMLGWMIDEVDAVALANQQDVVRNERRQSFENRPYGVADEALYQALYPEGHPYRAAVIGSHADIQRIQLADVKAFARTYYRPNNATLVLAGDFDPATARAEVQKYFGTLRAGARPPEVKVPTPVISQERRLVVNDRVELARLNFAWHTPGAFAAGDAELDLAAHVLGGGKASRLHNLLVRDRQLAQSVQVGQESQSLSSVFGVEVLARPGVALADLEAAVETELQRLAAEPPSDAELAQARASIETQVLQRLEKVGSLADLVNHYNQMAGDPGFVGQDLARYAAATPAGVSAAVARWLGRSQRVTLHTLPGEQVLPPDVPTPPAPRASRAPRETLNAPEDWRRRPPAAGAAQPLALPGASRFALANGLTVIHVRQPGLPLISASLSVRAGQSANPPGLPGLASFTATLLGEGTQRRSSRELAEFVASLGASFTTESGGEEARISFSGLETQAAPGLSLMAEVLQQPAFAPADIERLKAQRRAELTQTRDDAALLANAVANRVVYGDAHPLAAHPLGTEASLNVLDAAAVRAFWQAHYRPDRAALVVASRLDDAALRRLVEPLFGAWQPVGEAPAVVPLPAPRPAAARVVVVDKPGAAQTALALVAPGPWAHTPDAAALDVMNAALGGLFTSRINTQLREVKGYTYGIYSGFTLGRERGQFGIRGSVRTEVTAAAVRDIEREVAAMRSRPLPAAELQRVRNARLLSLPSAYDTRTAMAGAYASQWSLGRPLDALVDEPRQLAAVSARGAWQAARQHLPAQPLTVVAVGDAARIVPQLRALGRSVQLRDAEGTPKP